MPTAKVDKQTGEKKKSNNRKRFIVPMQQQIQKLPVSLWFSPASRWQGRGFEVQAQLLLPREFSKINVIS
jgi:hypothetical protein